MHDCTHLSYENLRERNLWSQYSGLQLHKRFISDLFLVEDIPPFPLLLFPFPSSILSWAGALMSVRAWMSALSLRSWSRPQMPTTTSLFAPVRWSLVPYALNILLLYIINWQTHSLLVHTNHGRVQQLIAQLWIRLYLHCQLHLDMRCFHCLTCFHYRLPFISIHCLPPNSAQNLGLYQRWHLREQHAKDDLLESIELPCLPRSVACVVVVFMATPCMSSLYYVPPWHNTPGPY